MLNNYHILYMSFPLSLTWMYLVRWIASWKSCIIFPRLTLWFLAKWFHFLYLSYELCKCVQMQKHPYFVVSRTNDVSAFGIDLLKQGAGTNPYKMRVRKKHRLTPGSSFDDEQSESISVTHEGSEESESTLGDASSILVRESLISKQGK